MAYKRPPVHPVTCLVCMARFGDAVSLAHVTRRKMCSLVCRTCNEYKAYRKLREDPEFRAAVIRMWDRERLKREALLAQQYKKEARIAVAAVRRFSVAA